MATNDESDSLERLAYKLSLSAQRHQETSLTELRVEPRPRRYPEVSMAKNASAPPPPSPPPPRLGIPETRGNGARKS
jgi:hypothetical protein